MDVAELEAELEKTFEVPLIPVLLGLEQGEVLLSGCGDGSLQRR